MEWSEALNLELEDRMSSIARGKVQRTMPRWYYLLQIPRLLGAPLFRAAQKRIVNGRAGW